MNSGGLCHPGGLLLQGLCVEKQGWLHVPPSLLQLFLGTEPQDVL